MMSGKLYIVGTPIGNLNDFSPRGKEILESVDFICAEDTRVSIKLLNRFEIKKELVSLHKYSIKEKSEYVANRIKNGENAAVITDAGMPCISDPGEELCALCHQYGIGIFSVPGPSALISALSVSGISSDRKSTRLNSSHT